MCLSLGGRVPGSPCSKPGLIAAPLGVFASAASTVSLVPEGLSAEPPRGPQPQPCPPAYSSPGLGGGGSSGHPGQAGPPSPAGRRLLTLPRRWAPPPVFSAIAQPHFGKRHDTKKASREGTSQASCLRQASMQWQGWGAALTGLMGRGGDPWPCGPPGEPQGPPCLVP